MVREPYPTPDFNESHFCRVIGSTVYAHRDDCPYCGTDE